MLCQTLIEAKVALLTLAECSGVCLSACECCWWWQIGASTYTVRPNLNCHCTSSQTGPLESETIKKLTPSFSTEMPLKSLVSFNLRKQICETTLDAANLCQPPRNVFFFSAAVICDEPFLHCRQPKWWNGLASVNLWGGKKKIITAFLVMHLSWPFFLFPPAVFPSWHTKTWKA